MVKIEKALKGINSANALCKNPVNPQSLLKMSTQDVFHLNQIQKMKQTEKFQMLAYNKYSAFLLNLQDCEHIIKEFLEEDKNFCTAMFVTSQNTNLQQNQLNESEGCVEQMNRLMFDKMDNKLLNKNLSIVVQFGGDEDADDNDDQLQIKNSEINVQISPSYQKNNKQQNLNLKQQLQTSNNKQFDAEQEMASQMHWKHQRRYSESTNDDSIIDSPFVSIKMMKYSLMSPLEKQRMMSHSRMQTKPTFDNTNLQLTLHFEPKETVKPRLLTTAMFFEPQKQSQITIDKNTNEQKTSQFSYVCIKSPYYRPFSSKTPKQIDNAMEQYMSGLIGQNMEEKHKTKMNEQINNDFVQFENTDAFAKDEFEYCKKALLHKKHESMTELTSSLPNRIGFDRILKSEKYLTEHVVKASTKVKLAKKEKKLVIRKTDFLGKLGHAYNIQDIEPDEQILILESHPKFPKMANAILRHKKELGLDKTYVLILAERLQSLIQDQKLNAPIYKQHNSNVKQQLSQEQQFLYNRSHYHRKYQVPTRKSGRNLTLYAEQGEKFPSTHFQFDQYMTSDQLKRKALLNTLTGKGQTIRAIDSIKENIKQQMQQDENTLKLIKDNLRNGSSNVFFHQQAKRIKRSALNSSLPDNHILLQSQSYSHPPLTQTQTQSIHKDYPFLAQSIKGKQNIPFKKLNSKSSFNFYTVIKSTVLKKSAKLN